MHFNKKAARRICIARARVGVGKPYIHVLVPTRARDAPDSGLPFKMHGDLIFISHDPFRRSAFGFCKLVKLENVFATFSARGIGGALMLNGAYFPNADGTFILFAREALLRHDVAKAISVV